MDLHRPAEPSGSGIVLTHGAGGTCHSPLLVAVAEALSATGLLVGRFDLPFRQRRPYGPPSPSGAARDREGIRDAVESMRQMVSGPVYMGGHSYGGRQSSILASGEPGIAEALLLLSYPLHPPAEPHKLRTAHFPALRTPVLFVHGLRDEFATEAELDLNRKLIPAKTDRFGVAGAGHDLKRGQFDLAEMIAAFNRLLAVEPARQEQISELRCPAPSHLKSP